MTLPLPGPAHPTCIPQGTAGKELRGPRGGDLYGGVATVLEPPFHFEALRAGATRSKGAIRDPNRPTSLNQLYASLGGYSFTWGHILEQAGTGPTYYFVPVDLIERGARTDTLAALAAKWFEDQQALFEDYVTIVDGPACIPFALRANHPQACQWLSQVFLPRHFEQLLHIWRAGLGLEAGSGKGRRHNEAASIHAVAPVTVIYRPVEPGQNQLQLVLMTSEPGAKMCYVTWNKLRGLVLSDWIALPRSEEMYVLPTTDLLIDFYREQGHMLDEFRMPLHEPAIEHLVHQLIASAGGPPSDNGQFTEGLNQ